MSRRRWRRSWVKRRSVAVQRDFVVLRELCGAGWVGSISKLKWRRAERDDGEERLDRTIRVKVCAHEIARASEWDGDGVKSVITGGFSFENSTVTYVQRVRWFVQRLIRTYLLVRSLFSSLSLSFAHTWSPPFLRPLGPILPRPFACSHRIPGERARLKINVRRRWNTAYVNNF